MLKYKRNADPARTPSWDIYGVEIYETALVNIARRTSRCKEWITRSRSVSELVMGSSKLRPQRSYERASRLKGETSERQMFPQRTSRPLRFLIRKDKHHLFRICRCKLEAES